MAFNARTYRANKYRRQAWTALAEAREIKARVLRGEPRYPGEGERVRSLVFLARNAMRLCRGELILKKLGC